MIEECDNVTIDIANSVLALKAESTDPASYVSEMLTSSGILCFQQFASRVADLARDHVMLTMQALCNATSDADSPSIELSHFESFMEPTMTAYRVRFVCICCTHITIVNF